MILTRKYTLQDDSQEEEGNTVSPLDPHFDVFWQICNKKGRLLIVRFKIIQIYFKSTLNIAFNQQDV